MKLELKFDNDNFAALRRLTPKKQRRNVAVSMNRSLGPIKREMRRLIRAEAYRHGHLSRSIHSKVKIYPGGYAFMVVGVKERKFHDGSNPSKYFHLVDLGVKPFTQVDTVRLVDIPGQPLKVLRLGDAYHPGFRGKNIRARAAERGEPELEKKFIAELDKRMQKCLKG